MEVKHNESFIYYQFDLYALMFAATQLLANGIIRYSYGLICYR